jgi:hypothetical protein
MLALALQAFPRSPCWGGPQVSLRRCGSPQRQGRLGAGPRVLLPPSAGGVCPLRLRTRAPKGARGPPVGRTLSPQRQRPGDEGPGRPPDGLARSQYDHGFNGATEEFTLSATARMRRARQAAQAPSGQASRLLVGRQHNVIRSPTLQCMLNALRSAAQTRVHAHAIAYNVARLRQPSGPGARHMPHLPVQADMGAGAAQGELVVGHSAADATRAASGPGARATSPLLPSMSTRRAHFAHSCTKGPLTGTSCWCRSYGSLQAPLCENWRHSSLRLDGSALSARAHGRRQVACRRALRLLRTRGWLRKSRFRYLRPVTADLRPFCSKHRHTVMGLSHQSMDLLDNREVQCD